MLSYLRAVAGASRAAARLDGGTPAGTVVVRSADLLVRGGETVAVAGGVPSAGELAVFCRPVVTAPAVARRDGTVLADAWLPGLVRLGELERHLGGGVIGAVVGAALANGRLRRRQRRRLMSYPLGVRLMLAMALMPGASHCQSLARLAGVLAGVPFALGWHVPTEKVVTGWRVPVPADVMEDLFWAAAGPLTADGEASAVLLADMMVCAAAKVMDTVSADRHGQQTAAAWIGKEKPRDALNLRARITGSTPCERDVRGSPASMTGARRTATSPNCSRWPGR